MQASSDGGSKGEKRKNQHLASISHVDLITLFGIQMNPIHLPPLLYLLVICIAAIAAPPPSSAQQSRAASIQLHARWNGTSYISEAAEFLVGHRSLFCIRVNLPRQDLA